MLLLGIDIGTSSVKVAVVDAETRTAIASAIYPDTEMEIRAVQRGWAEQSPALWWQHTCSAIVRLHAQKKYTPADIKAIGIAYQMHGLVLVDKDQQLLRDSIIWCDSRAVAIGNRAFAAIGGDYCLEHLMNSPGNFTASKLAWVKEHEPQVYERIDKMMLPGDFIAMKLCGNSTTSISALSEGIFWDFQSDTVSSAIMDHFGFDEKFIPPVKNVFEEQGRLLKDIAKQLSLTPGIPVTYKAGDQPNNALSLNVLEPGEVAATAGTSGVIYGVTDSLKADAASRVNNFAHVNYTPGNKKIGVLLCINGSGILNRWVKNTVGNQYSYDQMNEMAAGVSPGSDGLLILPFGNGAERMLGNRTIGAGIFGLDLNLHTPAHIFRAAQEGVAFAFRYGLDIMRSNGMNPSLIRAAETNMFLSNVFLHSFVNATGVPVQLYKSDGSVGAAIGAGMGAGIYKNATEAFSNVNALRHIEPEAQEEYEKLYQHWKHCLELQLAK